MARDGRRRHLGGGVVIDAHAGAASAERPRGAGAGAAVVAVGLRAKRGDGRVERVAAVALLSVLSAEEVEGPAQVGATAAEGGAHVERHAVRHERRARERPRVHRVDVAPNVGPPTLYERGHRRVERRDAGGG